MIEIMADPNKRRFKGDLSIPLAHPQHAARPQIPPRRGRPQLNFSQTKEKVGLDKMGVELEDRYKEVMQKSGCLKLPRHDKGSNTLYHDIATDIADLEPVCELGHGTCGVVMKMRHKQTSHMLAVKQMRRSGNVDENKRIIMDLEVVLKSQNCHIVQCFGYIITQSEVWICMELMASCLDKLSKRIVKQCKGKGRCVPENILGKVAVATLQALNYLKESHGVMHRDIKPSNILIDERGQIKLCDFGISGRLVDSKAKTRSAGCAAYLAPERIDPPDPTNPDYDVRADVWALGISLVELATGEFPYTNCKTDFEVLAKVMNDEAPTLPPGFSMHFDGFVKKCLRKDVTKRPKYRQLLDEDEFLKRYHKAVVDVAKWYVDVTSDCVNDSPSGTPMSAAPFNNGFSPN